jgi:hypothetical protein
VRSFMVVRSGSIWRNRTPAVTNLTRRRAPRRHRPTWRSRPCAAKRWRRRRRIRQPHRAADTIGDFVVCIARTLDRRYALATPTRLAEIQSPRAADGAKAPPRTLCSVTTDPLSGSPFGPGPLSDRFTDLRWIRPPRARRAPR